MSQMLSNGLVFRYRSGTSERVTKDGGFGGECERIVAWPRLPFRPSGGYVGHILDETMDSTIFVMPVRRPFGNDEEVAFIRHSQCPLERPENHLIDIGIRVGMFVDQQPFRSGLIGAGQSQMP